MSKAWFYRCLKTAGALAARVALSGCAMYPAYGPRYNDKARSYTSC